MQPNPAPNKGTKVVAINEQMVATVARGAQYAFEQLTSYKEAFFSENGVMAQLYSALIAIMFAVSHGRPPNEIETAVVSFSDLSVEFTETLQKSPFNNPTLEELIEFGNKHTEMIGNFTRLSQEVEQLRTTLEHYAAERSRLTEKLEEKDRLLLNAANSENRLTAELSEAKSQLAQRMDPKALNKLSEDVKGSFGSLIHKLLSVSRQLDSIQDVVRQFTDHRSLLGADIQSAERTATAFQDALVAMLSGEQPLAKKTEEPQDGNPHAAEHHDLKQLRVELNRREEWMEEVNNTSIALQSKIDDLEAVIESAKFQEGTDTKQLNLQLQSLKTQSSRILVLETSQRSEMDKLQKYIRALETVSQPLPEDLFSQKLPEIPEVNPDSDTSPEGAEHTNTQATTEKTPDAPEIHKIPSQYERMRRLEEISNRFNMEKEQIFITTLYEIIPDDLKSPQRGVLGVIGAAKVTSLVSIFFQNAHPAALLGKFRGSDESATAMARYLKYKGTFGPTKTGNYIRTDAALPWAVSDLFSQEEITKFQDQFRALVLKKQ